MDEDRENIERRIAEAKRSMAHRLAALGDRLDRTRQTLSLRQKIEDHPIAVFGAAVAVGLLVGWRRGAARASARANPATALAIPAGRGLVSVAAHALVRSLVTSVMAGVAARLLEQFGPRPEDDPGELDRLDDPDRRTTGVRVYPLS